MTEAEQRELFIRRLVQNLELFWLAKPYLTYAEMLATVTESDDDEKVYGDFEFEVEQLAEDE